MPKWWWTALLLTACQPTRTEPAPDVVLVTAATAAPSTVEAAPQEPPSKVTSWTLELPGPRGEFIRGLVPCDEQWCVGYRGQRGVRFRRGEIKSLSKEQRRARLDDLGEWDIWERAITANGLVNRHRGPTGRISHLEALVAAGRADEPPVWIYTTAGSSKERTALFAPVGHADGATLYSVKIHDESAKLNFKGSVWMPASPPRGIVLWSETKRARPARKPIRGFGVGKLLSFAVRATTVADKKWKTITLGPIEGEPFAAVSAAGFAVAWSDNGKVEGRWIDGGRVVRKASQPAPLEGRWSVEHALLTASGDLLVAGVLMKKVEVGPHRVQAHGHLATGGFDRNGKPIATVELAPSVGTSPDVAMLACGPSAWLVHLTARPTALDIYRLGSDEPERVGAWQADGNVGRLGPGGIHVACSGERAAAVARFERVASGKSTVAFVEWTTGLE